MRISTEILENSFDRLVQRARKFARLQRADQDVTGSNLGFAEEQSGVMPAAIEQIHDGIRDRRHLGLVLAEAVDRPR